MSGSNHRSQRIFHSDPERRKKQEDYLLNRPDQGLLVNTGIWRTLHDFSSGSVCFVLASELYDAEDYIYEFEDFLEYAKENNGI